MTAQKYNLDAIEQCRVAVSGLVGKTKALGDDLPKSAPDAAFGTLGNSSAVGAALRSLATKADTQFDKAGGVLGGVERALEAIGQQVHETEQSNKKIMT